MGNIDISGTRIFPPKLENTKLIMQNDIATNNLEVEETFNITGTIANNILVGAAFASKEKAKQHVQLFSELNFSPLVLHRSYVRKNSCHRMNYMCPYGIPRKSRSTGLRQSVQKYVGCPVVININQQADRAFVVRKAELVHKGHDVG